MRQRLESAGQGRRWLIAVAAVLALALAGFATVEAATPTTTPAPRYWIVAQVQLTSTGDPVLVRRGHAWPLVANSPFADLLKPVAGNRVYIRVSVENGALRPDGVLGFNASNVGAKVQPATDDYSALTYVGAQRFCILTGQTTSEEEEGGLLYWNVAVSGGGTSADKNTGYALATELEIYSW